MTTIVRVACALACIGWSLAMPVKAQPTPQQAATMEDAVRLRKLTMGMLMYMQEHDDRMPADLSSISLYVAGDLSRASPKDREAAMREAFMTAQDRGVPIPADADGAWLAKNSSYAYLAGSEFKSADLAGWERLAIAHLKFDRGLVIDPAPERPDALLFSVAFLDSHVEIMNRADAEAVVAESAAVFEAFKSGKPLPDSHQVLMDLRVVLDAVKAYSKAHEGMLPPSLGATLEYVPVEPKRRATPAERAKVFLSPRAKATTHVPDEPTAEWVNEKTSWVYLGAEGVALAALEDPRTTILVHGRFDAPMEFSRLSSKGLGIPVGMASGDSRVEVEEYARWSAGISRSVMDSARTGAALPDHLNAHRDVRLILNAMVAYSKEHDGMLPPDLGATLPYVMKDAKAKDRAQVFLSPARERAGAAPDELTSEWVNSNSSYTYLSPGSVNLKLAQEAGAQILVHGPVAEAYDTMTPGGHEAVVAIGMSYNYPWLFAADHVERMARESREILQTLHAATK